MDVAVEGEHGKAGTPSIPGRISDGSDGDAILCETERPFPLETLQILRAGGENRLLLGVQEGRGL